jgi:hypothetical protein
LSSPGRRSGRSIRPFTHDNKPPRVHASAWAARVGAPLFIYQLPDEIVVIMASGPEVRRIDLNVPHSADPKPSWYGESVGRYEGGDTLVIDTIGFLEHPLGFVDNYRTPRSKALHVIERWKLSADGNFVDVTVDVEDPGVFTMPWRGVQRWRRVQQPLREIICAENNDHDFLGFKVPMPKSSTPDF